MTSLRTSAWEAIDDTTVFVKDEESVEQLLRLLDEFKSISGLKINTSKTEAMWLGCWRVKLAPLLISNGRKNLSALSAYTFHITLSMQTN